MFTGIVTDVGRVRAVRDTDRDRRFEIETAFDTATIDLGASVSHAGCCLTVVEKGPGWLAVEVSGETYVVMRERDVHAVAADRLGDETAGLYL